MSVAQSMTYCPRPPSRVLVTGGGRNNPTLMAMRIRLSRRAGGTWPAHVMREHNRGEGGGLRRDGVVSVIWVNFRLRSMIEGQRDGVSLKYLGQYTNHSAWLEYNGRANNGALAKIAVSNAMDTPASRNWRGCWQRAA